MKDKRVLFVSSEVVPYLPETEMATTTFELAKSVHNNGGQTRIFMPRFGVINERRYQLHEVIRLSGMNLIINDMDVPLIIKVASIPKERMQVYFIDNDEYFKRKAVYRDEDENLFADNDERALFFVKGVVETVKKLNWSPDIIHVHGWMASLLPLYLKEYYNDDPLFTDSKIVTSLYDNAFEGSLNESLVDKIKYDELAEESLQDIVDPNHENLMKNAIANSDALIQHGTIDESLQEEIKNSGKPSYSHNGDEDYVGDFLEFYTEHVL
jgi:starch synthase